MYYDNHALSLLKSQEKLSNKHMKWVEYLQAYTFTIKLKKVVQNKVADVLSKRLLTVQEIQLQSIGIDSFKALYVDDEDFTHIYKVCKEFKNSFHGEFSNYTLKNEGEFDSRKT